MNSKTKEIFTKTGLVGIAALSLVILYKVLTNDLSHIGEYINRNTEAMASIQIVVENNTAVIKSLEREILIKR